MRASPLPLIAAILALGGLDCAHAGSLPVCSGKHRRPANLYGSVLSEGLSAVPAARVAPASPAKSETSAAPPPAATGTAQPKDSAPAAAKASLAPCGAEARP